MLTAALLFAVTPPREAAARSSREVALAGASTDIERIVGNTVEIHTEPAISRDAALPAICRMLTESFHDASEDPSMRGRMEHLVHEIIIERWTIREVPRWVTLRGGVLTIQTLTDQAGIDHLRPLVVRVLKESVHPEAKRGQ